MQPFVSAISSIFKMKKVVLLFVLLYLAGCKKDDLKPSWDSDMLLPLAFSTINIHNLVDDSLCKVNTDSSISLVYQTDLASLILDTIVKIPDTNYQYTVSLNKIALNPYNFNYRVSMGDIANKDKEDNGPSSTIYTTIMTAHNTGQPTAITSFGPYNFDSIEINTGNYFKYIYIRQATIEISINNQLPVPLTNISFELKKQSTQEVLINDGFSIIPPNSQQTRTATLSNIVLDSLLMAAISVSSPGSSIPITIDTSQSTTATVTIKDLQIDSAVARFPSQEILKYNQNLVLNLPDSIQLTEAWIRQGNLKLDFYNTIKQNIHIDFSLPAAIKNGQPFTMNVTIPASDGVNLSHTSAIADFTGYKVKFRGLHDFEVIQGDLNNNNHIDVDTVNALYYNLRASIDSTGEFITLTKNDSISAICRFENVIPDYVKGFFGYKQIAFDSTIAYRFIQNLQVQDLHFQQANFSLSIDNQIGTNANAYIQQLSAKNTQTNRTEQLQGNVLQTPFLLIKPTDPMTTNVDVVPTTSSFSINSQNSNIQDLISILPDQLAYSFRIKMNDGEPLPSPATANDFVYYGDQLKIKLNAEIPLSFYAQNLILCDTVLPNFSNVNIDQINYGNIILLSNNYFPIDMNVTIYMLNENKELYDSLHTLPLTIHAGVVSPSTHKVNVPSNDKNTLPLSKLKLQHFLDAKYLVIKASFNTKPTATHIKIYDYYTINLKLIGDFNYHIQK